MTVGGHGSDDAPGSDDRVPIILVCSTGDLELADGAATGLRSRGFDVAVMGAAEDQSSRLAEVVERFEGQGLYVLCRGGQLDRDGVDRLRATLRSLEVPFGRTLTLPTTAQGGARGLEERIVSVARRMVTGRFEKTQMSIAAGTDASLPAPHAEAVDPGDAQALDPGDVDRWVDSLAGGTVPRLEDAPGAGFGEDGPTAVVSPSPGLAGEGGLETNPSLSSAVVDDYEPIDRTMVTRHPMPEVEREESSAPTTASAPRDDDDDIDASAFSSGPNIRLFVGGGVALVLIIVLAIALSGSDDPQPADDVVAAAEEAAPAEDAPPASPSPVDANADADADPQQADAEEAPAAKQTPPTEEAAAAAPEEAAAAAPEEAAAAAPEEAAAAEPETFDLEGAEKALSHRSTVDLALLDDAPLPPSAPENRAAIAQALEEREIRSWNAFLIAGDDAPNLVFKDAETFCKTLSAGGISGWRLPSIGELLSLSGAKLLDRKGVFWSETPGDAFGDTRMVVNAKKGSTASVTVGWDGARPICVRVRE
ncbi:MAG: hypothetical protein ACE37F_34880 [Nannocystaceae bacterium]|nr:DUF1566 domain-containing protein [bacterium]